MSTTLVNLTVKLFTDGADKVQILDMAQKPWIKGFTTNPSLLKKAGVVNYEAYGRDLVAAVPDRHISFEVFSDDIPEMIEQARIIASWGDNVYVKLPVTTTRGGVGEIRKRSIVESLNEYPSRVRSGMCHATSPPASRRKLTSTAVPTIPSTS